MGATSRIVAAVMNKHAALVSIGRYLGMFDAKVKVEARYKSRAPVRPAASSPSSSTSKLATMEPPDAATGFIALTAVLV